MYFLNLGSESDFFWTINIDIKCGRYRHSLFIYLKSGGAYGLVREVVPLGGYSVAEEISPGRALEKF